MTFSCYVTPINVLFVGFVGFRPTREFFTRSFRDVAIAGEGFQILIHVSVDSALPYHIDLISLS